MRIAQVAPLIESVPPRLYGGTERIVHFLTEELVANGHRVTLFASGDSRTGAELVACCPRALRLDPNVRETLPQHIAMIEEVRRRAEDFDVIHFHIDMLHFPVFADKATKTATTLHGRLDLPELAPVYRLFDHIPLVSISDAQRAPMPPVNWVATVHHGLPDDLYRPGEGGDYLAFLGRICPEKRPDRAIEIAVRAGVPLKIAAKVDRVDRAYFEETIAPLLDHPLVTFLGEIDDRQKEAFLGNARALLFPIDWPEPFGLVMIEALACATPVIAFRAGSVPEVIEDGLTGFVVDQVDAAVEAVARLDELDRRAIRGTFEARFSAQRMAADYIGVYERLLAHEPLPHAA